MLTEVLKVSAIDLDLGLIEKAAKAVKEGKLVVFPTETVYGIAANALDQQALNRLYQIKGRPLGKPFTWHIYSMEQMLSQTGKIPKKIKSFLQVYWPGPLTIVLKVKKGRCGFRMPDHPVALALIEKSKVPVVAPSANLSGESPPVTLEEALKDLNGKVDLALDGGKTATQKESTVVDLTSGVPKILREGAISKAEIDHWFKQNK